MFFKVAKGIYFLIKFPAVQNIIVYSEYKIKLDVRKTQKLTR